MTEAHSGLDLDGAVGAKRSVEHLTTILGPGETVLLSATAFLEGRSGVLAATGERLLFVWRDQTPVDAPYGSITAFRARMGVVSAELEVEDPGGSAVIKQIHPRSRLRGFAQLLQERTQARPG